MQRRGLWRRGRILAGLPAVLLAGLLLPTVPVNAQREAGPADPAAIEAYLEDPRRTGENQEPPHAALRPYADAAQALADPAASADSTAPDLRTPWTLPLDGQWRFRYADHHRDLPAGWQSGEQAGSWPEIAVPGVWQQQGYDHPIYRNVSSEISPYAPPQVPDDRNPTGAYVRGFDLPGDWDGRRQLLRFEGVTSGYFVWINGRYVGYDQGGYTPAEWDVTEYLRPGGNTVAVQVHRWGSGAYLENMDFWHFSGIFRGVELYSVPRTHLEDVTVRTDLDDTYTDATLRVLADLRRVPGGGTGTHQVRATLHDPDGRPVTQVNRPVDVTGERASVELVEPVAKPRLWSDETPDLYTLVLELVGQDGRVTHTTRQPVGFREVVVRDKQILLNGKSVDFRGVNRHEHDPDTGRTIGRPRQLEDIRLMRQHNVNAVRTAHYPNDPYFYRLADRNGILVDDEVDVETHWRENCNGTGDQDCLADRPEWQAAFLDRFVAMVERDKNHPSILMWDTGNEAGLGQAHYAMAEWIRQADPTRLVYHQPNSPDGDAPFADVWGPRYPSPARLRQIAKDTTKPVVMGEWLHAMGNSLGHYEDMWQTIRAEPALQGGFVWDWVDQGLTRPLLLTPDRSGNGIPAYLAGNPSVVDGVSGKGLLLSGLDDWVEAYRDPKLEITGRAVTLDVRVKPLAYQGSTAFIAKGDRQWALQMPDEKHVEFFVYGQGGWHTARAEVPAGWWGNWHRLTGVYDGGQVRLLVDGKEVAATAYTGEIAQNTKYTVSIGRNNEKHGDSFAGRTSEAVIDSVRVYDTAVDPARIAAGADPADDAVLALDFDQVERKGDFLYYGSTNFLVNGVINADRTPQPELAQMAYSHAPIRFEPVPGAGDAADGRFVVRNLNHTLSTAGYELRWTLVHNGKDQARGTLGLDVPPGGSGVADVALPPAGDEERFLRLEAVQRVAAPNLPVGHVLAREQLRAGGTRVPEPAERQGAAGDLALERSAEAVTVRGKDFRYRFDTGSGQLASMVADGRELLAGGPVLDVFRAPIGNEWGSWGRSEETDFRRVGLDRLVTAVDSVDVRQTGPREVRVDVATTVRAPDVPNDGFRSEWSYLVDGTGQVRLRHDVEAFGTDARGLPWLPRVGLALRVPEPFGTLDWYGRGPGESYPDRKNAAHIGRWSGSVDDQWFDFLPPQDNGVKSDTSWAALSDGRTGLLVAGEGMEISADRFSNAERTDFAWQLRRDPFVTFHISKDVTGLGDTPVQTQPQYRVRPDVPHSYTVTLRPYRRG